MSERAVQDRIAAAARASGWWVCWTHRSEHSPPGEPDMRCLWAGDGACPGPSRYLLVELKTADASGRYRHRTDAQRQYAAWAALAGLPVLEVRWPVDRAVLEGALGVDLGASSRSAEETDKVPTRPSRPPGVDEATWSEAVALGPRATAALVAEEARRHGQG